MLNVHVKLNEEPSSMHEERYSMLCRQSDAQANRELPTTSRQEERHPLGTLRREEEVRIEQPLPLAFA